MLQEYTSVGKAGRDEVVIKRSRFIGAAAPAATEETAWEFIEKVKEEHKQATHNVYAFQVGDNNQIQRYSDDGEPSGTAGIPVLEVIKNMGLKYVVVVVTRYFGGTLLGANGLVRAYTQGARAGILAAGLVKRILHIRYQVIVDYAPAGKLQNIIMNSGWYLADTSYGARVCFTVLLPPEQDSRLRGVVMELTGGHADIRQLGTEYLSIPVGPEGR